MCKIDISSCETTVDGSHVRECSQCVANMRTPIILQFVLQSCLAEWIEISHNHHRKTVRPLNRDEFLAFHPKPELLDGLGLANDFDVTKDIIHPVEESIGKINIYKNVTKAIVKRVKIKRKTASFKNTNVENQENANTENSMNDVSSEKVTNYNYMNIPNSNIKQTDDSVEVMDFIGEPLEEYLVTTVKYELNEPEQSSQKTTQLTTQKPKRPFSLSPLENNDFDKEVEIIIVDDDDLSDDTNKGNVTDHNQGIETSSRKKNSGPSNEDKGNVEPGSDEPITETNTENTTTASNKKIVNTFNSLISVLKKVREAINLNSRSTFQNKVKYLKDLQNSLMATIEERVAEVWREEPEMVREKRSEHVGIASPESALMSISFLTFAVFLIKLVMQVIHAYKNKAMMMSPAVFTAVGKKLAAHLRPTHRQH